MVPPLREQNTILLLDHGRYRRILNHDVLLERMKVAFPECVVKEVGWDGMPLADQLELMVHTRLTVSVPGAGVGFRKVAPIMANERGGSWK